jgi:hypothetical protein
LLLPYQKGPGGFDAIEPARVLIYRIKAKYSNASCRPYFQRTCDNTSKIQCLTVSAPNSGRSQTAWAASTAAFSAGFTKAQHRKVMSITFAQSR